MKTRLVAAMGAVALMALQWTSANASTVLAAVDGNVNFLFNELGGAQLGLFDDDQGIAGPSLAVPVPSLVTIAPDGSGNFTATNSSSVTLPLTDQPWFVLGVSTDSGNTWIGDLGVISLGADAFRVLFQLDSGAGGGVVAVDVQLAPTVVPVPAALWLFGSGLIGLLVTARRKAMHSAPVL
jgi:hypothetical protein